MAKPDFIKDPDAVLDYGFDWSDWLATSEIISDSSWTVPDGITEESSTYTDEITTIWLSSGTVGIEYELVNHITTNVAREDDRTMRIRVVER